MEFILACNLDYVIGINGGLPWNIPEDLAHFKKLTSNNIVVMGRKTFESINNKPLPNRINIVITSQPEKHQSQDNLFFINSNMIQPITNLFPDKKIFIIGGEQIFKMFESQCVKVHLTLVFSNIQINDKTIIYKPPINNMYDLVESTMLISKSNISYKFFTYSILDQVHNLNMANTSL